MPATFNEVAYKQLLVEFPPKIIESEEDYNRALESVEKLMYCKDKSPEQDSLLNLLVSLIEAYEEAVYPIEPTTPLENLLHLMDARDMRQADLVGILGSRGVVSEVINGKRSISKTQAKALADLFGVSSALFI